ncbi:hypothetical protein GH810_13290 [Acetobacterium paludosum]|uniref:Uncharacterized protein n=1 Tax=Acetobacterium paludosum TaxID=52693 RepID=A0A923HVG6_9FIRM|nr:hypothetical protein [Acetobacterium paludosum]MBC3889289.1 hypothetical protein [Acetobacterium paludosum]
MMIKQRLGNGIEFVKTKIMENKQRTGAVFCILLVLIGFFMPFMSAKAGVSVTGIMNNSLEIISPENNMLSVSLGDFVLQKPIDEITVYNTKLGDIKLFDQSVLGMLRNPIPDKGVIGNVNEALSSSALDYLVDPKVQEIIATRLARGDELNVILVNTWNAIQDAKKIVGAVNDISIQARQSMNQVNETMAMIDGYKSTANGFVFVLFVLMIGLMALILYKRANIKLSIVLSGIMLFFFAAVGIGTSIANNQINLQIAELVGQVNNSAMELIRSVLTGTFGDIGTFLANFIGEQANFLKMSFSIQLNAGYWVILLGLLGSFILCILVGRQNKKQSDDKQATAEVTTETEEKAIEMIEGKASPEKDQLVEEENLTV